MFAPSLLHLLLLAIAIVIFIPAVIIGSIGAQRLTSTREEQNLFVSTNCFVTNITEETLPYDCSCDGCHPTTCYAEHFAVSYSIANGTVLTGMIDINEISYRPSIEVNQTYPCVYDRTNVKRVQWTKPSERPELTMLIVGFSIAGVTLIAVLIGTLVWAINQRRHLANRAMRL